MDTLTFPGVAPAQIQALIAELRGDSSTTVTETAGGTFTIARHPIQADASYDPASQTLTVNILKHGLIPIGMIRSKIATALTG
jgi:hypothetical protein